MTEEQWQQGHDLGAMLQHLRSAAGGYVSFRKLRLLLAASGRTDSNSLGLTEIGTAERFADGEATRDELRHMNDEAWAVRVDTGAYMTSLGELCADLATRWAIVPSADEWTREHTTSSAREKMERGSADLIRDVFGNPFRPVAVEPAWLTSTAVALAVGVYAERAFDRLPILADAIQDAGCEDEQVLGHCRGPGPHVRGCWVVDMVLGKK